MNINAKSTNTSNNPALNSLDWKCIHYPIPLFIALSSYMFSFAITCMNIQYSFRFIKVFRCVDKLEDFRE